MSEDKKKILLIDDEVDLTDMLKYQFEAKGYETAVAHDGFEGLEEKARFNPDLIILDLNMPKMGGIEFYQKICGADGRPSHPVLVLTARANTEQLFKEFDVDGFMTKPFDIHDLIKQAETIIKKKERIPDVSKQKAKGIETVFIVENDPEEFGEISVALLKAGYRVDSAQSGAKAIEKMMLAQPDLALVKLGLTDLAGDLVVLRLNRMAQTSLIKCILYSHRNYEHNQSILDNLKSKTGVFSFVEYQSASELLTAIDMAVKADKE